MTIKRYPGLAATALSVNGVFAPTYNLDTTPPTKSTVGLGNVDNTSDLNKPLSSAALVTLPPVPASGQYFYTASPQNHANSVALNVGNCRVVPWLVPRTISLARLAADVVTVGEAGSKFRVVIYADNGSCYPGALVVDAGQIAGDSATMQELTVSVTLTPGLYWVGGAVQNVVTTQPTMRVVNTIWTPPVMIPTGATLPATGTTLLGLNGTGVTGAAPATFPAGAGGSGLSARIAARIT